MKLKALLMLELVIGMVFQLWRRDPNKVIDAELVTFDPIPFADVEYLTPEYYVYYMMEHYGVCMLSFLLWYYLRWRILLVFMVIKISDLIDFLLCFNTIWFDYHGFPFSFNIASVVAFGTAIIYFRKYD